MPSRAVTPPARKPRIPQRERTRREILEAAEALATREGLQGLTIGRLAEDVGMSKAGVFAHFGSKEALQLATVAAANALVDQQVATDTLRAERGMARLTVGFERYFDFIEGRLEHGGCFFLAAALEMDDRPGEVREQVRAAFWGRDAFVAATLRDASERGELRADLDLEQLSFELLSLATGGVVRFQLSKDPQMLSRARRAIHDRLEQARAPSRRRSRSPRTPPAP